MKKEYLSAPLPFVGQKRMFASKFKEVLKQYPDDAVYVDLFGGSGLLSHIVKHEKPGATVVYNDYDDYRKRLENIPRTNMLLSDLRRLAGGVPEGRKITGEARERIFRRIEQEEKERGYVDYITISASLMFSMKYKMGLDGMRKEALYNNIRKSDYPAADGYLDGLEIIGQDYREVFNRYKDVPGVVFLVDPPYLCTDVTTYTMSWGLSDYLDVLTILHGHPFIYFTSNKSSLVELCRWMGRNPGMGDPFRDAGIMEFNARVNYNSSYTDMMLYSPMISNPIQTPSKRHLNTYETNQ